MSTEGDRRVDLTKGRGADDAPKENGGGDATFRQTIAALIILIMVTLGALWLIKGKPEDPVKTAPVAVADQAAVDKKIAAAPQTAEETVTEEEMAEQPEAQEVVAEISTLDSGIDKICRGLAKEFVDVLNPSRETQERTLILYNINRCSNMYIRNADAERHGLTAAELQEVKESEDVGHLRVEDE